MSRRRVRPVSALLARFSREGRAFLFLVCASAMLGADPGRTQSHVLVLATASLLFAAWLPSRLFRLRSVKAELELPERVSVGDEFNFSVRVHNGGSRALHRLRIESPRFGRDGKLARPPAEIPLLDVRAREHSAGLLRFTRRGVFHIEPFRVTPLLPLGLSQGIGVLTPGASLTVAPRVARIGELRALTTLQRSEGAARSRRGDDSWLAGVRPYRVGDPIRHLHARSWARHGSPMVREYHEEQSIGLGVLIDPDASAGEDRFEAALSIAAGIVAHVSQSETRVAWIGCGVKAEALRSPRGLGALHETLDVLAEAQPGGPFVPEPVLGRVEGHLPHVSLLVFIATRWDGARASFVDTVRSRGLDCSVVVVEDQVPAAVRAARVPVGVVEQRGELRL